MNESINALKEVLGRARRVAFLGGAGVSTQSGIPDFRSGNGAAAAQKAFGYPPETLLSHEFFMAKPDVFYQYYKGMLIHPAATPNPAHMALARLEAAGKLTAVITQNIDGLHQKAGSQNVLELHGSVYRNTCMGCKRAFTLQEILSLPGVPRCACGGIIKPDVVLYGEGLDNEVVRSAIAHISRADVLIVGGTSLVVYPAAGLVDYFSGSDLVLINKGETSRDSSASLTIRGAIGDVLAQAVM